MRTLKLKKNILKQDINNIEYVIYVRKSSDESSEHQKQSIADQIRACIKYADDNSLKIKNKPENFSDFEDERDIYKEDNAEAAEDIELYQDTRHLYIIKEEKTGKIAGKRPKWRALIKLIKAGKINGLLSYSPDRQARNMLEGGEIIDLVDQNKLQENKDKGKVVLSLKYSNFHFEDNASGKMMLGIWFAFSKQYSDKLSEDSTRGTQSSVKKGKSVGVFKHGYRINENGFHEPHPKFFKLIQEAFKMKLDGIKEDKIKQYLDNNGYVREYKKKERKPNKIGKTSLNFIFRDPFYYGIFINGEVSNNQIETNPYYKPMISEEEFQYIEDNYNSNPIVIAKSKTKDDYENIKIVENGFARTFDGCGLTFYLPNRYRFDRKIKKARDEGKILNLEDIVSISQPIYECKDSRSKLFKKGVKMEELDIAVAKKMKEFNFGESEYGDYKLFMKQELNNIRQNEAEKISYSNAEINKIKKEKTQFIEDSIPSKKDFNEEERMIYDNKIKDYDTKIAYLKNQIESFDKTKGDKIMELDVFKYVLKNAEQYYKNATYVQKNKIIKLLFLNITINTKKRLQVQVQPELEPLSNSLWCQ